MNKKQIDLAGLSLTFVFQETLGLSSAVFESPGTKFQESHVKMESENKIETVTNIRMATGMATTPIPIVCF